MAVSPLLLCYVKRMIGSTRYERSSLRFKPDAIMQGCCFWRLIDWLIVLLCS